MRILPAFLSHKASIGIVVAVLAMGAAVGAFASQDVLPGTSADTVATETDDGVTDDGATGDETSGDTEGDVDQTDTDTDGTTEETDGDTEDDGTVDEDADETEDGVDETETDGEVEDGEDEDLPRETVGIPDENPNFGPENGDGTCEKGETVVKTTPSGKQVNVPCHAVERGPPDFSKGKKGGDATVEDGDDVEDEGEEEVE
ncbi:MAG: hypothetical protein QME71_05020 [Dehalococcoidia bacterium]|nr:hypothetical protein [Dehalococcoidia bacterium]